MLALADREFGGGMLDIVLQFSSLYSYYANTIMSNVFDRDVAHFRNVGI